jgi:hypothetical protein
MDVMRVARYATPMPVPGKLEVTIKINTLPADVATDAKGWKTFVADCDGTRATVYVRPRVWNKLAQAAANWPSWVAAITGSMGQRTPDGFEMAEPNIQVFERKPKPAPAPPPGADT